MATNATDGPLPSPPGAQNPETGSASATLTVVQVGPPLSVSVAADKSVYTVGDKVTILLSANRPAEGRLTISPPSGAPSVFDYQLLLGSYSITKTLTASTIGHWTVSFQADDYCSGVSSAQTSFDVSPNTYDVSLSLNGVATQYSAQVQVDGQPQGTIGGGQIEKLTFKLNTSHTISVDQYVAGDTGVRFYCAQNTLSVTSSGSFTFSYQTQYQFTIDTDPTGVTPVTGGGWFPAGTSVQTSQAPQVVAGGTGTQYAFKGWEVNGTPQSGNPISVTLDKPYTAIAKYTTQYQLVVDSAYGNPQGSGYYDAGSQRAVFCDKPIRLSHPTNFRRVAGRLYRHLGTGFDHDGQTACCHRRLVHQLLTPHRDNCRSCRNRWRSSALAVEATSPTRNKTYPRYNCEHKYRGNWRDGGAQVRKVWHRKLLGPKVLHKLRRRIKATLKTSPLTALSATPASSGNELSYGFSG